MGQGYGDWLPGGQLRREAGVKTTDIKVAETPADSGADEELAEAETDW